MKPAKKSILLILPLLALWILTAGMGARPSADVPMPEVDFRATVKDDQDISTKVHHATWDGDTFLSGTRGKGSVTISFEKIKKAAVVAGSTANGKVDFQITLRSGEVVAVTFSDTANFTGTTNFGTYKIIAKNIKEILFE